MVPALLVAVQVRQNGFVSLGAGACSGWSRAAWSRPFHRSAAYLPGDPGGGHPGRGHHLLPVHGRGYRRLDHYPSGGTHPGKQAATFTSRPGGCQCGVRRRLRFGGGAGGTGRMVFRTGQLLRKGGERIVQQNRLPGAYPAALPDRGGSAAEPEREIAAAGAELPCFGWSRRKPPNRNVTGHGALPRKNMPRCASASTGSCWRKRTPSWRRSAASLQRKKTRGRHMNIRFFNPIPALKKTGSSLKRLLKKPDNDVDRAKRRIFLQAGATVGAFLLIGATIFGLTSAWYSNVVQMTGPAGQDRAFRLPGSIQVSTNEITASPGDSGVLNMTIRNNGEKAVNIRVDAQKEGVEALKKRIYCYTEQGGKKTYLEQPERMALYRHCAGRYLESDRKSERGPGERETGHPGGSGSTTWRAITFRRP